MKKLIYTSTLTVFVSTLFCGEGIYEKLYDLKVPGNEVTQITLSEKSGSTLPLNEYPKMGNLRAFKLMPPNGSKPIDIVIRTEPVNEGFLAESERLAQGQSQAQKDTMGKMNRTARKHKEKGRGVNTIYKAVETASGIRYKLLNLRVPGINENTGKIDYKAMIVATPKGNLQLFEESDDSGEKEVIELDTSGDSAD